MPSRAPSVYPGIQDRPLQARCTRCLETTLCPVDTLDRLRHRVTRHAGSVFVLENRQRVSTRHLNRIFKGLYCHSLSQQLPLTYTPETTLSPIFGQVPYPMITNPAPLSIPCLPALNRTNLSPGMLSHQPPALNRTNLSPGMLSPASSSECAPHITWLAGGPAHGDRVRPKDS